MSNLLLSFLILNIRNPPHTRRRRRCQRAIEILFKSEIIYKFFYLFFALLTRPRRRSRKLLIASTPAPLLFTAADGFPYYIINSMFENSINTRICRNRRRK